MVRRSRSECGGKLDRADAGYWEVLRVGLRYQSIHPAYLVFLCQALWSINERLGGERGLELEQIGRDPLFDLQFIHDTGGIESQAEPIVRKTIAALFGDGR